MKKGLARTWCAVAGTAALAVSAGASADLSFENTTSIAGLRHSGETWGASWGDYNGDGYPDVFVGNHRDVASLYRNNGDGTFSNVMATSDGSGVWIDTPFVDNHGAAWADFDGDGDQDLLASESAGSRGKLLANEGGILYDRSQAYDMAGDSSSRGPVWFDYDRDGDLDLAIMALYGSTLYTRDNTTAIDFDRQWYAGFSCEQMDYGQLSDLTGDGVMELICADGAFPRKVYDISRFPFGDITSMVPGVQRTIDSAIADFDGDLDPDVFIVSGRKHPAQVALKSDTHLEANVAVEPYDENGFTVDTAGVTTFTVDAKWEIADNDKIYVGASGMNPSGSSLTLDPSDPAVHGIYPHDPADSEGVFIGYDPTFGRWTVLVSGRRDNPAGAYFTADSTAPMSNATMISLDPEDLPRRPSLLVNTGGGFSEVGGSHGLRDTVSCVSVAAGDYDNDMDVDVYAVCRGGVQNLPNRLYENLGDGTFVPVTGGFGAEGIQGFHIGDRAGLGESAITADYDVDGCLDLFVTNGLPMRPLRHHNGPDQMFRNRCDNGNHWVEIDLRGNGRGASNPDGIGATVYVTAGGVTQMREQNGGYHRWSQNHQRLHFGLAANIDIDQIRVEWPSGRVDVYPNATTAAVPADRLYRITEGQAALSEVGLGGGGFPDPQPGDECGAANFDAGSQAGIFLWRNCSGGGNGWSVRATAGGSSGSVTYTGTLATDGGLLSVSPYLFEGVDSLDTAVPGQVGYRMRMRGGGVDGFDFSLASGAEACLSVDAPAGTRILVGHRSLPADSPLDLRTLETCAAQPELGVDDISVDESAGTATFTVSLAAASGNDVRVDYDTADGTANAGSDYTASAGTLVLAAGETSGEIEVPLLDDTVAEGPETFSLLLGNAQGAVVADGEGVATIEDDEVDACGAPNFDSGSEAGVFLWQDCGSSAWRLRATAGGGSRIVYEGIVTAEQPFASAPTAFSLEGADALDTSSARAIGFTLHVANAGVDGFDFEAPSSGQTCVNVNGTLYLGQHKDAIGDSVDLATLQPCSALPRLMVEDASFGEATGTLSFPVTLSAPVSSDVLVDYATADGTAVAGGDYTAVDGTLTIPAGETSATVDVPLLDDGIAEGPESFTLQLSAPQGAVIEDAEATGTIEDDELYACGAPAIDSSTEAGLFIWQDCGTGQWQLRVSGGGGSKVTYTGQVGAAQPFPAAPTPYSLEGADFVDATDPLVIAYGLYVQNSGQDGFDFQTPATGQTCLTANVPIHVGATKDLAGQSVNLATLEACQ